MDETGTEADMRIDELYVTKRPTYVGVKFDGPSVDEIMKLTKGVDNRTSKDELHITLIYSRKPISISPLGDLEPPVSVKAKNYSIFTTRAGENCLVLEVTAPALVDRHNEIMDDYGASYDFEQYKPHITLSYDCGVGFDIRTLPAIDTVPELFCSKEYASELDSEWLTA